MKYMTKKRLALWYLKAQIMVLFVISTTGVSIGVYAVTGLSPVLSVSAAFVICVVGFWLDEKSSADRKIMAFPTTDLTEKRHPRQYRLKD